MRVLLLSPLPKVDPACGDVTYTETLLAHPPEGVQYVDYASAIARGDLVELGRRKTWAHAPVFTAINKLINAARGRKVLFWEPFRRFWVKPGAFDLVHVHVFNCGFQSRTVPVVLSNAAPLRYLYTEARGWSQRRANLVEKIEIGLSALLGVDHTSYRITHADRVIAFTRYLQRWYVEQRGIDPSRIDCVPIYLPPTQAAAVTARQSGRPRRVGFVAKDFDAKGGPSLLAAFAQVRARCPDAELTIVGCEPRLDETEQARRGIRWLRYVPREQLLREIMPSFDVFAYPTLIDGQPLVVMEALAVGCPVITTDYQAMPEMVADGQAGAVVPIGNADALAERITDLLVPEVNATRSQTAREHFEATYSADRVRPQLRAAYEKTIDSFNERRKRR